MCSLYGWFRRSSAQPGISNALSLQRNKLCRTNAVRPDRAHPAHIARRSVRSERRPRFAWRNRNDAPRLGAIKRTHATRLEREAASCGGQPVAILTHFGRIARWPEDDTDRVPRGSYRADRSSELELRLDLELRRNELCGTNVVRPDRAHAARVGRNILDEPLDRVFAERTIAL